MNIYNRDTVIHFFSNILDHYAWQGLALCGVLIILFFTQLYYYAFAYYRIYSFRLLRQRKRRRANPAVSVIVVVRGENEPFLAKELPTLLKQTYASYEIVVVYVGSDIEYYDQLQSLRNDCSYMRLTKVGGNNHFFITTKQALNIGIKSAQYDHLLFTTPGTTPRSERWVEYMAKGFERGNIVVGSSVPDFQRGGLRTYLMMMTEYHNLRNAMARAVADELYYAPQSNYGFTKELYYATRGYNHLGIDIGDNDLYIQDLVRLNPRSVAVVLSPHSVVEERRSGVWSEWMEHTRYYGSTYNDYPLSVRSFIRRERNSRVLFFLATLVALVVLPLELKIGAFALLVMRYGIALWSSHRTARKLGFRDVALRYWIYDLTSPLIDTIIRSKESNNTPRIWT